VSRKVLVASGNAHKIEEMRRLIAESLGPDSGLEIVGLPDVPAYPEPVEDGRTFEENALIKAWAGFKASGLPTLADDSGIAVDVLNEMPGVRSARWAGPGAGDEANLQLLLRQVSDVEAPRRTGRFVCALALVADGVETVARGVVEGVLTTEPRGENGFGYDPIFLPDSFERTTAEMSAEEKDAISHRGRAVRAMAPNLEALVES
jgi:XTP/dITP diphosphohydrolase